MHMYMYIGIHTHVPIDVEYVQTYLHIPELNHAEPHSAWPPSCGACGAPWLRRLSNAVDVGVENRHDTSGSWEPIGVQDMFRGIAEEVLIMTENLRLQILRSYNVLFLKQA